jgi:hypothetical protein
MIQPFAGLYAPVTFGAAFLKVPFRELVGDYVAWTRRNHPHAATEPCDGSLRDALDRLAPLTAPVSKELLVDLEGRFTAILSNSLLVGDAFPRAAYWSNRMTCEALAVTCAPDKHDCVTSGAVNVFRAMQVQLFTGHEGVHGVPRRTVTASKDGDRWAFDNQGEPFPFEDTQKFSNRRVRDRFGAEDVLAFCRHFGLRLSAECTCERALLLSFMEPRAVRRSLSYAEAVLDQHIEIVHR